MELELYRRHQFASHTIGSIYNKGIYICNTLEPRTITNLKDMPTDKIKELKIKHKISIPEGRYEIKFTYSNRFKVVMPILLNVRGFEGIRIHAGNTVKDTEGCILVGIHHKNEKLLASQTTYQNLYNLIQIGQYNKQKTYITIRNS